ncbi:MAG: protein kinase [Acidobacteriota bacterium]
MIGQTLGHYEIVGKLGQGGMGVVYLAHDTILERKVALKVLPADLAESQKRLERFEREAKALAALDHPNIVVIHSVENVDGVHFLTMQLVEGKRLADLIPAGGMPLQRIFEIAIPLTEALVAAHAKGVIHRDLKPANIMVTDDGRVKVLDFGLAKLRREELAAGQTELSTDTLSEEGHVLGTLPYMSPEQLEGVAALDARSDIFSLGSVLYEMTTGERPFQGASPTSVLLAIMKESPVDPDALRNDLPHHLARVVRRCLEKEPDRRYQRAKDLLHEFEDLRREEVAGASSSPTTSGAPQQRSSRSTRKVYGAVGAAVLAITAIGFFLSTRSPEPPPAPMTIQVASEIRSIAVLPLTNLMNDPEQEYFVDGMTEALIASLAKIGDLKVISRTSAMQYKGVEKPLPEIAGELGVDALIEGSVLRSGDEVRITAQLIDGRTDENLWVETYDRDIENVLRVHSEVARAVASEVKIALTGAEQARLAAPQVDAAAQEAYLKGQYFVNRLELERALEYFGRATEADPKFALPWAGRAAALAAMAAVAVMPPGPLYAGAEEAALAALALDDKLATAHQALGWVRMWSDWDWTAAERRFRQAVELEPSDPWTRWGLSNLLLVMGRQEEAMTEAERALELDPLSPLMQYGIVWNLYLAHRYDEVIEEGRKVLELFPDQELVHSMMVTALESRGQFAKALSHARYFGATPGPMYEEVLDRSGEDLEYREVHREVAERLEALSEETYVKPHEIAIAWAYAGEKDRTLTWLERMVEEHDPLAVYLVRYPLWDPVRSDPRFHRLVEQMNLPQ